MFFSHGGEKGGGEVCGEKGRMDLERYEATASKNFLKFTFISEGSKGKIKKVVKFQKTYGQVYNVALSDVDEKTGETDDSVVTNNNDTQKILATVAIIVLEFFRQNPDVFVMIRGYSPGRMRLFRRAITANWDLISPYVTVYGQTNKEWIEIDFNEDYPAFLIHTN